jgi:hypothetical protein
MVIIGIIVTRTILARPNRHVIVVGELDLGGRRGPLVWRFVLYAFFVVTSVFTLLFARSPVIFYFLRNGLHIAKLVVFLKGTDLLNLTGHVLRVVVVAYREERLGTSLLLLVAILKVIHCFY